MTRKALVPATAALILATLAFAQNASHNPPAPAIAGPPDRQLMQQIMDAWSTLNPDVVAKFYDQSPEDVFYDDAGGVKFVGWHAYADTMRKVMAEEQSCKWTVNDDAVVHRAGDSAWGTATVHSEYVFKNGSRQVAEERWTLIWAKKGGNWLVVHEHFSAPPSDSPQ